MLIEKERRSVRAIDVHERGQEDFSWHKPLANINCQLYCYQNKLTPP